MSIYGKLDLLKQIMKRTLDQEIVSSKGAEELKTTTAKDIKLNNRTYHNSKEYKFVNDRQRALFIDKLSCKKISIRRVGKDVTFY